MRIDHKNLGKVRKSLNIIIKRNDLVYLNIYIL